MNNPENLPAVAAAAPVPATALQWSASDLDGGQPASGATLKRYLAAVRRYKWLVLAVAVVGTAGAVFGSRYLPSRYVAEATLWFSADSRQDDMQGPIQSSELLEQEAWVELIRSWTVLDSVTLVHALYLDVKNGDRDVLQGFQLDSMFRPGSYQVKVDDAGRTFELKTKEGSRVASAAVGDSVGRDLGFLWAPPRAALKAGRAVSFTVMTPREGSKALAGNLVTRMARGGNFMSVQYTGDDPARAATVVNAVAERFVNVAADLKKVKLTELRDALQAQLATAESNLRETEMGLEGYRVKTITLPSEPATPIAPGLQSTQPSVLSSYFNMKVEREQLAQQRQDIASALPAGPGDTLSVDALSIVQAVQESPELKQALVTLAEKRANVRALAQQYMPAHPIMQRAQGEVDQLQQVVIPALAQRVMAQLQQRMQTMDRLVSQAGGELKQIPTRAIEEARYQRSKAIAENLYNNVSQRYEAARLATETSVPDVRILDRATRPQKPALDARLQMILLGLAGSIGLGLLLSILLDRIDPKLRYAEQVTQEMGLAVLGVVPNLGTRGALGAGNSQEAARVLEALRSIRLTIMHAYGTAGPVMVTVTSPGSGDGKTFVSSNLALSFADLGFRTLVIDGDTRRGGLHRIFGLDRKPGLTDYLAEEVELNEIVRRTKYPSVDLIPGGSRRANSPELLSGPRMGELLAQIKSGYGVVLIDSPPLGAGVDPLVLATLCGNLVLVMRTGKTEKAMARAKLEMLDRLPVRLLGTILNGFDSVDSYRYYSYMPGYESHRETPQDGEEKTEESELLTAGT
ncbi:MAG: polysaccharide biosynthesis tyrosine autokinase [Gemmatimonadetes bacterium]|nr:polysaccharide biosynthesis tyrosine autokinase [Gemmatimonadota bacterium]